MEFCDFQVVFLWNFVIKYYARRQVLYLPLLPDLLAQTACEERKTIKILATKAIMLFSYRAYSIIAFVARIFVYNNYFTDKLSQESGMEKPNLYNVCSMYLNSNT